MVSPRIINGNDANDGEQQKIEANIFEMIVKPKMNEAIQMDTLKCLAWYIHANRITTLS